MLPWLQTLLALDAIIDGGVASDQVSSITIISIFITCSDNSFHYVLLLWIVLSLQLFLALDPIIDGGVASDLDNSF